jgi:hypothetical protein
MFTASSAANPAASPKPQAVTAAVAAPANSTTRGSPIASAARPPSGPATSRTAAPAASTAAISAGDRPAPASTGGRNGSITPTAKNCAA